MATKFIVTVKSSGGDYTSLNAAQTDLVNDITLTTIKVYSISASTEPTIQKDDEVVGVTSGHTGICVLVNSKFLSSEHRYSIQRICYCSLIRRKR